MDLLSGNIWISNRSVNFVTMFTELVGDPVKDSALLAEVSPVLHTDKIKTPFDFYKAAEKFLAKYLSASGTEAKK